MNQTRTPTAAHQPTARPTPAVLEPPVMDASVPAPARVWNYWLGGKDHYETDRQAADEYRDTICPTIAGLLQAACVQTRRVTHRLTEVGIDQFIDIGVGLPVEDHFRRRSTSTRMVYVDNDPVALAHGRALLGREPRTTVLAADVRDPEFTATALQPLDQRRPILVILGSLLGHLTTADATVVMETLRARLPAGSQLLVTDLTTSGAPHLIATHPGYQVRPWRVFAALARTAAAGPVSLTTIGSDTSSGVAAVAAHITVP